MPATPAADGVEPTPETGRLSSPLLIGRDVEVHRLLGVLLEPPSVALVTGEAGVGKTRLIRELLDRPELDGCRTLTGQCQPLREPFPLGTVVEALRGLRVAPRGL